jgi:8-oxo-dGTP pyrophosphatase MutT (NUDIX family)
MKKADYDALPQAYKDAINADLEHGIKNSDPNGYALVKAVIDPSWSPPAPTPAPTLPSKPSNTAAMEGALNVLYGIDPKGHTTARQLQAYGVLHKGEFDQFNSVEQQKLLADLSYIATTSKAPNTKKRAQDLIDRFTPAGTPLGTVGQHAVYPPVSSVQGQTRLPEPDGKAGLLKKATNPGQSGDGWLTLPNGGRGPWGKYGAAGLLLRHVDPNDGKERYLMVQRGPGISDPGKWQFPGGAIDSNESPYEGGAREVIEELGFKDSDLLAGRVHGYHEFAMPGTSWKYTSIAATVPDQLKPDLSTHHARAETSDAKWMTIDEIRKLDSGGKLLKPLTGGALERNVVSLFPANATAVARPGPVTRRPGRLAGTPVVPQPPAQALPHKVIKGKNLVATQADQDKLRADVKAVRKNYRGKSADERLSAIAEMQGFDATPTTVSKQEMDRLLATGDYIEMWRGVSANRSNGLSASDINESYRTGTAHYGLGVVGNGYYFATDKAIAEAYSDRRKGSVLRVLLPKSAVIGKYNDVRRDSQNTTSSTYFRQAGRVANGTGTLHDEGRYAAAAGIDAIEVSASKYRQVGGHGHLAQGPVYVLLNRGITIAQEE